MAAVALHAVLLSAQGTAHPSALTINYIDKVEPGADIIVRAQRLGGGRSIVHWRTEVTTITEERMLAQAMVVLTTRRPTDGHTEPKMPEAPDPVYLKAFYPPAMKERIENRRDSESPIFNRETTSSVVWVREVSGRPMDHLQLAYLADAYAPRCYFWSEDRRPNATMTLSVYFHGSDDEIALVGDDYILNEAIGTRGADSTSGQQARLWSRQGALLATTEQLSWYR